MASSVEEAALQCEACQDPVAIAFMQAAAASGLAGIRLKHGGPFGASIVRDGVIIACAHNMVLHREDPTRHAEMNAIQQACQAIGSHDLSDCELYTTCEPCPMCWGAVQWSRLGKVHIGVDRFVAASYGFDDKAFYDEVELHAKCYGIHRTDDEKKQDGEIKSMVEIFDGLLHDDVTALFTDPAMNRTLRWRFSNRIGMELAEPNDGVLAKDRSLARNTSAPSEHEDFMRMAVAVAKRGVKHGMSKEREPFGAIVVKDGVVLSEAFNTVLESHDATATAEVNAIRAAAEKLGTHNLEGCVIYTTAHPDLMSLGAVLWSRISKIYCGVSQQMAAQCGFEEGLKYLKDLQEDRGRRATSVVDNVAKDLCEAVFKEWSDRNGVIY
jgi:guanine deaminase